MTQCEYKDCEKRGIRHLARHYFCNHHNKILRRRVVDRNPNDLKKFVENYTQ